MVNQCRGGVHGCNCPHHCQHLCHHLQHSSYTDLVLNTSLMYYIASYHDIYIDYLIQSLQQPYEIATIIILITEEESEPWRAYWVE